MFEFFVAQSQLGSLILIVAMIAIATFSVYLAWRRDRSRRSPLEEGICPHCRTETLLEVTVVHQKSCGTVVRHDSLCPQCHCWYVRLGNPEGNHGDWQPLRLPESK